MAIVSGRQPACHGGVSRGSTHSRAFRAARRRGYATVAAARQPDIGAAFNGPSLEAFAPMINSVVPSATMCQSQPAPWPPIIVLNSSFTDFMEECRSRGSGRRLPSLAGALHERRTRFVLRTGGPWPMAKVMVVDDAYSDLMLMESILKSAGHQVVSLID